MSNVFALRFCATATDAGKTIASRNKIVVGIRVLFFHRYTTFRQPPRQLGGFVRRIAFGISWLKRSAACLTTSADYFPLRCGRSLLFSLQTSGVRERTFPRMYLLRVLLREAYKSVTGDGKPV